MVAVLCGRSAVGLRKVCVFLTVLPQAWLGNVQVFSKLAFRHCGWSDTKMQTFRSRQTWSIVQQGISALSCRPCSGMLCLPCIVLFCLALPGFALPCLVFLFFALALPLPLPLPYLDMLWYALPWSGLACFALCVLILPFLAFPFLPLPVFSTAHSADMGSFLARSVSA